MSHMGFSNSAGGFSDVSGGLVLDPKNPAAAKLSIKLPVTSVATASAKLIDAFEGDRWLDARKPPGDDLRLYQSRA